MLDVRARRMAWSVLAGATAIEGVALLWVFQRVLAKPQRLEHYFFAPQAQAVAWILAAATALAYVAYAALRSPLIGELILSVSKWRPYLGLRLVALAEAFVTGIFEEVAFRRFLMDWAAHRGAGAVVQIAASAVVFGVVHSSWGVFSANIRAAISASLATGVLGALLGVVYLASGRSLAPCVAAHITINLLLEPWLILAAATGSWGRRGARPT